VGVAVGSAVVVDVVVGSTVCVGVAAGSTTCVGVAVGSAVRVTVGSTATVHVRDGVGVWRGGEMDVTTTVGGMTSGCEKGFHTRITAVTAISEAIAISQGAFGRFQPDALPNHLFPTVTLLLQGRRADFYICLRCGSQEVIIAQVTRNVNSSVNDESTARAVPSFSCSVALMSGISISRGQWLPLCLAQRSLAQLREIMNTPRPTTNAPSSRKGVMFSWNISQEATSMTT